MDEDRELTPPEPGLAELFELERRIEAEFAAAQVEARRVVETARCEARDRREASDGELDVALRVLRERMWRECEETVRASEAGADAEVASFERAEKGTVDALGRFIAARLAGGDAAL